MTHRSIHHSWCVCAPLRGPGHTLLPPEIPMTPATRDRRAVLELAAWLRARSCGCVWRIVAKWVELREPELMKLVEEAGEWFEQRVAWLRQDEENEVAARRLRDLRNAPERAREEGRSVPRAWIALIGYIMPEIREDLVARKRCYERHQKDRARAFREKLRRVFAFQRAEKKRRRALARAGNRNAVSKRGNARNGRTAVVPV